MSREAKLLILTWVVIGLVIAGVLGFYLGKTIASKGQGSPQLPGPQSGQPQVSPLPTGGQQPLQGGGPEKPPQQR